MLKIYNTLSRQIDYFGPIHPPRVGMYSCGPTVYDYQHIGHMRRYVGDDILIRVLQSNGYDVHHVMNITDVGHLISDSDTGEDKMEKGAKKFGLTVWDIAKKFEQQFKDSCDLLNITLPHDLMHATEFIPDQIALIQELERKGFTYQTSDGIYFDTSKFPEYFNLSRQNPEELKAGIRVELGEKKNVSDFALWKFSYPGGVSREELMRSRPASSEGYGEARQMEWESPWGLGFPGWHIECSAMSMKALGPQLDIHTGGIDHINIHHTNEIAQSECATGNSPFAKYWIHHAFLTVEGQKMSKSLGNFYTVEDVKAKGFDPMALRYLYLQTHYRQEMNFTWEALEAAQTALTKLRREAQVFSDREFDYTVDRDPSEKVFRAYNHFEEAVNHDLNMPQALAAVHEGLRLAENDHDTMYLLQRVDEILGLGLAQYKEEKIEISEVVQKLLDERQKARDVKDFARSDELRDEIKDHGFDVQDTPEGSSLKKLHLASK